MDSEKDIFGLCAENNHEQEAITANDGQINAKSLQDDETNNDFVVNEESVPSVINTDAEGQETENTQYKNETNNNIMRFETVNEEQSDTNHDEPQYIGPRQRPVKNKR